MRSATLKWIIFLSALMVATILGVQLYWLNKIYSFEQRQFNNNIVKSVRGVMEDLDMDANAGVELEKLIEHPDANTFLIRVNDVPEFDSLVYYLRSEMQDFG